MPQATPIDIVLRMRDRASRDMGRALSVIDRRLQQTTRLLGAATVAAAGLTAAWAVATRRALDYADTIGKTADRLGVTTDALQGLRFAADRSGVSQRTFDMGLQRLIRRAGDAARGIGEAEKVFQQLGVTVVDTTGHMRPFDQIFYDVSAAIKGMNSDAEQLSATVKLVDSEAAGMVNVFRQGPAAIAALRNAAQDLGIVLDEALIRNAERAKDGVDSLTTVLRARFFEILLRLTPQIEGVSAQILAWARDGSLERWAIATGQTLVESFDLMARGANLVAQSVLHIGAAYTRVETFAASARSQYNRFFQFLAEKLGAEETAELHRQRRMTAMQNEVDALLRLAGALDTAAEASAAFQTIREALGALRPSTQAARPMFPSTRPPIDYSFTPAPLPDPKAVQTTYDQVLSGYDSLKDELERQQPPKIDFGYDQVLSGYDSLLEQLRKSKTEFLEWDRQATNIVLSNVSGLAGDTAALMRQLYEDSGGSAEKYWRTYQAFAIAQTISSTAQAIMGVWASLSPYGPPGLAAAAGLAGVIGALGAAKVGLIASQQPAQSFAEGGVFLRPFAGRITAAESGVGPEVIAPLSRLPALLREANAGGGDTIEIQNIAVIRGGATDEAIGQLAQAQEAATLRALQSVRGRRVVRRTARR